MIKKILIFFLISSLFSCSLAEAKQKTCYTKAGDGHVVSPLAIPNTWDIAHNGTIGYSADYTADVAEARCAEAIGVVLYGIYRAFIPFDTSSIPSDAIITNATLSVYCSAVLYGGSATYNYVRVVGQTTQASTTSLITADYDNCGDTHSPQFGSDTQIQVDPTTAGLWHNFPFNSTGLGWIGKGTGGECKIGLRLGFDVVDVAIGTDVTSTFQFRTSEYTGTDYDPYLIVTYRLPHSGHIITSKHYVDRVGEIIKVEN